MRALAALLVGGLSARLGSPLSQPDTSHLRLGFIDLQSGSRGAPQRIVFAAPPFQGVQSELFQLLWGRALLGVCVDCTARSRAGLTTRPLRRNSTVSVQTEQRTPDGWDSLLQAAAEREEQSAEAQAHTILIYLRGKNISGVGIVHNDDLHDVKDPFIRGAVVIGGHRFITDMYEAAQKRRASGKQCMVLHQCHHPLHCPVAVSSLPTIVSTIQHNTTRLVQSLAPVLISLVPIIRSLQRPFCLSNSISICG